ncbi:hypothetical protein BFN03_13500 [Rhodococcus sp. WMMA185]|nr:hypothetical protein BFN03_13500 [Rhodococcus sp. WMMA185]
MDNWSLGDIEVISRAIVSAPSIRGSWPWDLRLDGSRAEIHERPPSTNAQRLTSAPRADRLIACGASIANVELAMHALGRKIETTLLPDPRHPDLVATIRTVGSASASSTDLRLFSALARRRSHREAFAEIPVPAATIGDVVAAARIGGVTATLLAPDQASALADVLLYSEHRIRHEPHRRDIVPWTTHWLPRGGRASVDAFHTVLAREVSDSVLTCEVSDSVRLAAAIESETVLVFTSETQEPIDLLVTGIAMERAWLTAVDARLSASVLSHPLRIDDSAQRLAHRLNLTSHPQLILRIGY